MKVSLAQFELVNDAYTALFYLGDFETSADPRAWIRASNRLLDACIDAGMNHDAPGDHQAWAAKFCTHCLTGSIEVTDDAARTPRSEWLRAALRD